MRNYLLTAALLTAASAMATVDVTWQNLTHQADYNGRPQYVQRFVIKGDMSRLDRLAFNQFDRGMTAVNPADTVVRIIPGYYYIGSPRFSQGADSVVVDIITSGTCTKYSFGPDGVHGVDKDGKPFDVNFTRGRGTDHPRQWVSMGVDRMPYGDAIFDFNESITTPEKPLSPYDIVPSFKSVKEGTGTYTGGKIISSKTVKNQNPEYYTISVTPKGIKLTGASKDALRTARRTAERLIAANPDGLPIAEITDYPDYHYRGVMIDIARNNQPLSQMRKFVDAMADLRLNKLQFHIIDDEAWRLEIPGIPELTEVGARRGYTLDEHDFLAQIYAGNGDPNTTEGTANGYMTRKEFIDFLRYCKERGISVIPEIDTPGHSRAAVKSMEARYRRTGDDTYRLIEDGDTSVYHSAQDFSDNVMNPALPGPYRLMEKVCDEIIKMYKEAGAPLEAIHIGGDEVPHGAWSGSPSAQKFMKENGMTSEKQLHAHWVREIAKMLDKRGIKMNGWQEIALGHGEEYDAEVAPYTGGINLWVNSARGGKEAAGTTAMRSGYPVIFSDVSNFYLDLAYNQHPDERGLIWGGVVDEFKSLDGYPRILAPEPDGAKSHVIGVSGQLWSETMRSPEWMDYYMFPKMMGLAERGWNADSTYSYPRYNKVINEHIYPELDARGINYRMRQPGIKLVDGKIAMNSPYPDAVIRYTLDDSEPTEASPVYTAPIAVNGTKTVRARLYHRGKESVTTLLYIK
ncbi:MAG: family 20 glycosylhydrolase [Muribaculaceae bacterium]|nr:family 20 glycosylhydrolase [Muribaculaceae bacterium]